jgi:hypothetical protein
VSVSTVLGLVEDAFEDHARAAVEADADLRVDVERGA